VRDFKPCPGVRCKYQDRYYWMTHTSDNGRTWSLDTNPPGPAQHEYVPLDDIEFVWTLGNVWHIVSSHYAFKMNSRYDVLIEHHRQNRATWLRRHAIFWKFEGASYEIHFYDPNDGYVMLKRPGTNSPIRTSTASAEPESFSQILGIDHRSFL
jgi:hypothetical protein